MRDKPAISVPKALVEQAERERAEVIALCERVGYGFTIDVATRGWDALLKRKYGIEGHCEGWLAVFAKNLKKERLKLRRRPSSVSEKASER